jgi:hypothetical protein
MKRLRAPDADLLGAGARDRSASKRTIGTLTAATGGGGVHERDRLAGVAKGLLARVFRWRERMASALA